MKRVRQNYAYQALWRFSLMLAISFIVISCDSIVDQKIDADDSLTMNDTVETYSMDTTQSACINPDDPEYSVKSESKTIEWGNHRNPSSKTVDIIYYNTLDQFVLKLKSSERIADVLMDDESIKNFNGTVSPNTWQEFTFELEQNWEVDDTWAFELKIVGSGPPVSFDVDYQLIGECISGCGGSVTFMYDGSEVTYGTVIGANDRCWLDRNLGASRVAQSFTDTQAYGDLFQWGRAADGHQLRTSNITTEVSSTDTPDHGDFIRGTTFPPDWRNPHNDNLWQGVNGINNPCPSGFRLPTVAEWEEELQSWDSDNIAGAFASTLKMPLTGTLDPTGMFFLVDIVGRSWTSTVSGNFSSSLYYTGSTAGIGAAYFRGSGFPVRCILD